MGVCAKSIDVMGGDTRRGLHWSDWGVLSKRVIGDEER